MHARRYALRVSPQWTPGIQTTRRAFVLAANASVRRDRDSGRRLPSQAHATSPAARPRNRGEVALFSARPCVCPFLQSLTFSVLASCYITDQFSREILGLICAS